jgi:hypothetical protein
LPDAQRRWLPPQFEDGLEHGVEMPRLKTVRPKWALTVEQATALVGQLPWRLPRTMVGLALLTGLRRCELFALR